MSRETRPDYEPSISISNIRRRPSCRSIASRPESEMTTAGDPPFLGVEERGSSDAAAVRARFDALSGVCIIGGDTSDAGVETLSRAGVPAASFLRFIRCDTTETTAAFSLSSSSSSIAPHSLSDGASLMGETEYTVDVELEDEDWDDEDSRRGDGVSVRTTKPG